MLRSKGDGVVLSVRIQPGAKRTAVVGVWGEGADAALKIAVQAPPIEGRANEAVVAYLAKVFGVAKSRVEILQGELGRSKAVLLSGVALPDAEAVVKLLLP